MKKFFYLVFILALLSAAEAYGQGGGRQSSFNRDKLYWTAWDYSDGGIPKSLYEEAKFNTVIRQAKAGTINNLGELTQFQNIFAANTNAQDSAGDIHKYDPDVQLDWLYAVTGGYYNEFYAARASDGPNNQEFILERGTPGFGGVKPITVQGVEKPCFASGTDETNFKNKILLRGPHYYQHWGYELYSQEMERPITYNIRFTVYPDPNISPSHPNYNLPCVRTSVLYTRFVENHPSSTGPTKYTITYRFNSQQRTTAELVNDPTINFYYNYYYDTIKANIVSARNYSSNDKEGIEFVVEWLGNAEIFVEKVEVWDQDIWNNYVLRPGALDTFKARAKYAFLDKFNSSAFIERLRGWQSLNEPHTVDLLRSFRFVDSLCALSATDGFNTAPMFTMFYPNWDNTVDGRDFLKQIISIAKPNPLFYWYYP